MKSYQKVISNQIPQMKRKMIKDIGRDLIYTPLALLSGLVIGIPMAIVVCIVYLGSLPTWEYWSYHIEEKDLLSQYSPCCAFLINLPKTKAKPKLPLPSSKSILTNEDLKNLEEEEYGSLACAAMLNLWDFMR